MYVWGGGARGDRETDTDRQTDREKERKLMPTSKPAHLISQECQSPAFSTSQIEKLCLFPVYSSQNLAAEPSHTSRKINKH